jgi:glyoxylase-like metal-dependent hydrolase (beta-lactamase superfamily II)
MDEQSPAGSEAERLEPLGVLRLRAPNPGPLTLSGTNSWLVGRAPTWVIDPGPDLAEHIEALRAEVALRGGLGGIAITHEHADHVGALDSLLESFPAPLAATRPSADVQLRDGVRFGPLRALYAPGHSHDHFAFVMDGVCFTGDAVLGEGSVFIAPDPGALAGYLDALERLSRLELEVLCPGHGPAIWEPRERISQYIEHRLDRERRLLAALDEGRRTTCELLDAAWSEVPEQLRLAATITLQAHLDKLSEEGLLAEDVERSEG